MDEAWQQEARKLGGENLVDVITEIRDGQREMIKQLTDIKEENMARDSSIAQLKDAFPANDYGGHRRYHELLIAGLEERRKLRIAIQEKTIGGLIWAGLVLMGLSLWQYFKSKIAGN